MPPKKAVNVHVLRLSGNQERELSKGKTGCKIVIITTATIIDTLLSRPLLDIMGAGELICQECRLEKLPDLGSYNHPPGGGWKHFAYKFVIFCRKLVLLGLIFYASYLKQPTSWVPGCPKYHGELISMCFSCTISIFKRHSVVKNLIILTDLTQFSPCQRYHWQLHSSPENFGY